ncbi:exodeoxyribonuclease V subunit gamma, partial [Spirochaetota bacterium]
IDKLPPRISVFGISYLPPFHLDVLMNISKLIEVNLFQFNPSREYWADIKNDRERAAIMKREGYSQDLHLDSGNSLLASMGRLGRDFFGLILDKMPEGSRVIEIFEPVDGRTFLKTVQQDIYNMFDRGGVDEDEAPGITLKKEDVTADNSIIVNSCHSPMREVEVLYDYILDMFNGDSKLEPRDILVMAPDIETYAPYINAVFNDPHDDRAIPFSIADRPILKKSRVIDTFFKVLDLTSGRFSAAEVLDIIACTDVLVRFNLSTSDLDLIRKWVMETKIIWGISGDYKKGMGLPDFSENTWLAGINRLLLGYAMPGGDTNMFNDVLPYDNIEGSESLVLGNFINFFNTLNDNVMAIKRKHTLAGWKDIFYRLIDSLFSVENDSQQDIQEIRNLISRLDEIEEESGYEGKIDISVLISFMKSSLGEPYWGSKFITGNVCFCQLLPMRSIPFKVVCIIGLNGEVFPRRSNFTGFDMVAAHPKRGDRSPRDEDRYIFLEAIISAQERIYISYIGQNIQDNSEIPPSVVVSELYEYIDQAFEIKGQKARDYFFNKHRLQAFSTGYYTVDGPLFSYSEENYQANISSRSERKGAIPFLSGQLPIDDEINDITLDMLIRFFRNPARVLLGDSLGIKFYDDTYIFDDHEPFKLNSLERYNLGSRLLDASLNDGDRDNYLELCRARGILPHGVLGDFSFNSLNVDIEKFSRIVKSSMPGDKLQPLEVYLDFHGFTVTGSLDNIWPERMVHYRFGRARGIDRLGIWIKHLALNSSVSSGYPVETVLICKEKTFSMAPIENSKEILKSLVEIYVNGKKGPIYFFPETSLKYTELLNKKVPHEVAVQKAVSSKWDDGFKGWPGEGSDYYFKTAHGKYDPFGSKFKEISVNVYGPLLKGQKEVKQ